MSQGTVFACPRARRVEVFFDARGMLALVAGGRRWPTGRSATVP
jgi:hypothetical protein